jgi:hypothetical protein
MIHFTCAACGRSFSVNDHLAGRRGKCSSCSAELIVPQVDVQQPLTAEPELRAILIDQPVIAPAVMSRRPLRKKLDVSRPLKRLLYVGGPLLVIAAALVAWKMLWPKDDSATQSPGANSSPTGKTGPQNQNPRTPANVAVVNIDPRNSRLVARVRRETKLRDDAQIAAISPDGEQIAIFRYVGNAQIVTLLDAPLPAAPPYPVPAGLQPDSSSIEPGYSSRDAALFSPDGKRLAWTAHLGPRQRVIVDGVTHPEYRRVSNLVFSPDSRHLAYVAVLPDGRESVIHDGVPGAAYGSVLRSQDRQRPGGDSEGPPAITFSSDSSRWAYLATVKYRSPSDLREDEDVDCVLVVNDRPTPFKAQWEMAICASPPVFSPDGRHTAFVASFRSAKDSKLHPNQRVMECAVVVDGQPQKRYGYVAPSSLRYTADGRILYVASSTEDGNGPPYFVVTDGKESAAANWIPAGTLVASPDGKRISYTFFEGTDTPSGYAPWQGVNLQGSPRLMLDGQFHWYTYAKVTFSPDSRHAAWVGSAPEKDQINPGWQTNPDIARLVVYLDGKVLGETNNEQPGRLLQFSPDGRHVAWLDDRPSEDDTFVHIDGVAMPWERRGDVLNFHYAAADTFIVVVEQLKMVRVIELKSVAAP